jgi:hypothetical protein
LAGGDDVFSPPRILATITELARETLGCPKGAAHAASRRFIQYRIEIIDDIGRKFIIYCLNP